MCHLFSHTMYRLRFAAMAYLDTKTMNIDTKHIQQHIYTHVKGLNRHQRSDSQAWL